MKAFSTLNSKESFDEVSKKIRGAMQERGKRRRKSEEGSGGWDFVGSETGSATPETESGAEVEGRKDV